MQNYDYRVLRHVKPDGTILFKLHEVHYSEEGYPIAASECIPAESSSPEELRDRLIYMITALTKPNLESVIFENFVDRKQATKDALNMIRNKHQNKSEL